MKMNKIIINLLLILKLSLSQRRITNSSSVESSADTSFVVYIVAAETTGIEPGWLCGGSIIHPSLILTSAACLVTGTQQMYVISGYRTYVRTEQLELDRCTRRMKKRIVSYCVHEQYANPEDRFKDTSDERKYKWLKFDIGVARTDTPLDFYDLDYLKYCSYLPSTVRINYNSRYERTGFHVVVYGWGHATYYRPEGDTTDYNEKYLRYASTVIIDKDECKKNFKNTYVEVRVQDNFMCTDGKGNLDARGKYLVTVAPIRTLCNRRSGDNSGMDGNGTLCYNESVSNGPKQVPTNDKLEPNVGTTRRNGICQNDHGGPMIRWIGGHPFAIGVASAFRVNTKMQCIGPYLYSSVLCNSAFLNCILEEQNTIKKTRRIATNCTAIDKSYTVKETEIDWSYEDFL